MKKDSIFLEHIWNSIILIEEYTQDVEKERFFSSTGIQDMVFRRLEIIGEAVKNLSGDFKNKHTNIKWKEIAGLRDVLIHNYFGVDLDLTWNVLIIDLPNFKSHISEIRNDSDQKSIF